MPSHVAQGVGRHDVRPTLASITPGNQVLSGGLKMPNSRWLQSKSSGERRRVVEPHRLAAVEAAALLVQECPGAGAGDCSRHMSLAGREDPASLRRRKREPSGTTD